MCYTCTYAYWQEMIMLHSCRGLQGIPSEILYNYEPTTITLGKVYYDKPVVLCMDLLATCCLHHIQ